MWIRIENGQPCGPERLPDINRIGDENVLQARPEADREQRSPGSLHYIGHGGSRAGQREHAEAFSTIAFVATASDEELPDVRTRRQQVKGNVTSIGLDSSPRANGRATSRYLADTRPLRVADIAIQRQKPEERGEHVFPFRNPRHRSDMKRVQREHKSDKCAGRASPGRAAQREVKESGRQGMKQYVHQMMGPALHPEQFRVEQMRKHGDRHPVADHHRRERPFNIGGSQTSLDMGIVINMESVVINDEIEAAHLAINGENRRDQSEPDGQVEKPLTRGADKAVLVRNRRDNSLLKRLLSKQSVARTQLGPGAKWPDISRDTCNPFESLANGPLRSWCCNHCSPKSTEIPGIFIF